MSTKRLWFVLPLDIQQDPLVAAFGPEVDGPIEPEAQPARNRAPRIVDNELAVLARGAVRPAAPAAPMRRGYGFQVSSVSKKEFSKAYTSEEFAIEQARERASKEPKRPFGVFSCVRVFETMEAPIIDKEFNDAGELRIKVNKEEREDVA